jgi:hypothetical protein
MAYSTNDELFNNVKMIQNTFTTSPTPAEFATERIALADKIVEVDCSQYIDFSLVPDDETTPIVNLLSQYKAAEMSLRRIVGLKRRTQENDDIMEWKLMYDELKEKIKNSEVSIELGDGTDVGSSVGKFENTSRTNIRPNQGYDKYGEWLNNDDMYDLRGDVSDSKYNNIN